MEKWIKRNQRGNLHRSQNSYFFPLAEMASEAKIWTNSSHFEQQVNCWFTEKITWQEYNKSMKSNSKDKVVRTTWNNCWRCTAKFSQRMYGGCGIPLLQSGKSHCCKVILAMENRPWWWIWLRNFQQEERPRTVVKSVHRKKWFISAQRMAFQTR